jgi:hypothetical protein
MSADRSIGQADSLDETWNINHWNVNQTGNVCLGHRPLNWGRASYDPSRVGGSAGQASHHLDPRLMARRSREAPVAGDKRRI